MIILNMNAVILITAQNVGGRTELSKYQRSIETRKEYAEPLDLGGNAEHCHPYIF